MTLVNDLRDEALKDPEIRAEYDRLGPVYALVGALVEARHQAGLTQAQVAARMGTTPSVIARLENARHLPSLQMVTRYAAAIGRRVDISLVAA